jgi:hypothetical protein
MVVIDALLLMGGRAKDGGKRKAGAHSTTVMTGFTFSMT